MYLGNAQWIFLFVINLGNVYDVCASCFLIHTTESIHQTARRSMYVVTFYGLPPSAEFDIMVIQHTTSTVNPLSWPHSVETCMRSAHILRQSSVGREAEKSQPWEHGVYNGKLHRHVSEIKHTWKWPWTLPMDKVRERDEAVRVSRLVAVLNQS